MQDGTLVNSREVLEKAAQQGSRKSVFGSRKDHQAAEPVPHPHPNGTATINVQPTVAAC